LYHGDHKRGDEHLSVHGGVQFSEHLKDHGKEENGGERARKGRIK